MKIFEHLQKRKSPEPLEFGALFEKFRLVLEGNNHLLEMIADLEEKRGGEYIFDINYLKQATSSLSEEIYRIISNLNILADNRYVELFSTQSAIQAQLDTLLDKKSSGTRDTYTIDFRDIDRDDEDLVGRKTAYLAEIRNHIHFETPDGFAVTTHAYHRCMEFHDLYRPLETLMQAALEGTPAAVIEEKIEKLCSGTTFPPEVDRALTRGLKRLLKRTGSRRFAVRSSAVGEDALKQSHAGQFRSLLNVPADNVPAAFSQVLASRFVYLLRTAGGDMPDLRSGMSMAVSIQEMIPAQAAGVVYSLDPSGMNHDSIIISAVYGLGVPIVSGTAGSDIYRVSRLHPTHILEKRMFRKETMVVPAQSGGTKTAAVPQGRQSVACLTDNQIVQIAEIACVLDRYFKHPLDIEWALDHQGRIVLLQCRSLFLPREIRKTRTTASPHIDRYPILLHRQGTIANRGIAAGRVCHVPDEIDPSRFPVGAIAVTAFSSPHLASIIKRTAAIITDVGGPTGHMATIAREFGVPTIVGTGNATQRLTDGMEITVDALENVIYKGIIGELLEYTITGEDSYADMAEYRLLRKLLKRISPLSLIDPTSRDFTAKHCRTYHDIIRFAHEKAVQELIDLDVLSGKFHGIMLKDLQLTIPLGLKLIDIGGGLKSSDAPQQIVSVEEVVSLPMQAVLQGLTAPRVWSTNPVKLGLGDFVSSITRFSPGSDPIPYQGQNLAVVSDTYMNLSLRLGYHFNVIDAYLSPHVHENHVYFRFIGGVTENQRRHRRAMVIKMILEKFRFKVTVQGDLVIGNLKKGTTGEMQQVLTMIGKLIGYTRQLDARMESDASVTHYAMQFLESGALDVPPEPP